MALVIAVAPAVEPVSLAELKLHLRIDHSDEDTLLSAKAVAAREYVERYIGRPLISTTFDLSHDAFPSAGVYPPKAPLRSVTWVKYDDVDGAEQTFAADQYAVDVASDPGRIVPGVNGWPSTSGAINAVRIRFVAGYGAAADDVPMPLREAVLQVATQLFENRAPSLVGDRASPLPYGVGDTLAEYRQWSF